MTDRDLGRALLRHARAAIADELGLASAGGTDHPALGEPGATFVTLMQDGELRGCIGSLEARRQLRVDVRHNAVAAAFGDPRFAPLQRAEFSITTVEVSLLAPAEPVAAADEAALRRVLRPRVDGLILEFGGRRATFLPQVWEALPDPADFLAALKRKAGWPADFWHPAMNVHRYAVIKWKESEFDSPVEAR
jgi:AmmeMemoRadiSam system protein A